ncbi:class I SAM-dependent methyltransferase [Kribbella hippodromi]|uniref:Class I SAM-dependent methyltransferase n=1 Tax=Kribbella hippodromi TaxID=434347 RepID=A0ABP4Q0Y6_9ACTN
MAIEVPALTPVEESSYLTLCGRALDSRSPRSILRDTLADEVAVKVGQDPAKFPMAASSMRDVALRAKKLDGVVREFVAAHPDAVVLDLGVGLDNRAFRVDTPSTVDWYEVDLPGVAAVRRQVVPARPNVHTIAADLADEHWIDQVPSDRPAVVVADGLVAFLGQDDLVGLLNRLISHFPGGDIAFNGYTRFHVWAIKRYKGAASIADLVINPGFDDPHAPEQWAPGLHLREEIFLTRAPEIATYPLAIRLFTRFAALSEGFSRRGTTVLHYTF